MNPSWLPCQDLTKHFVTLQPRLLPKGWRWDCGLLVCRYCCTCVQPEISAQCLVVFLPPVSRPVWGTAIQCIVSLKMQSNAYEITGFLSKKKRGRKRRSERNWEVECGYFGHLLLSQYLSLCLACHVYLSIQSLLFLSKIWDGKEETDGEKFSHLLSNKFLYRRLKYLKKWKRQIC